MKSIFIKLLVVMSFFWLFGNSDVLAIDCYYQSSDGEEIKITIRNYATLTGSLYKIKNGEVDGDPIFFYPINFIERTRNDWNVFNNGCYLNGTKQFCDATSAAEVCPPSIINYYSSTNTFEYEIKIDDIQVVDAEFYGKIPIIEFSTPAIDGDNKYELSTPDFSTYQSKCINNNMEDICRENVTYKTKTFELKNIDKPNESSLMCTYRNSSGRYLTFEFVSRRTYQNYWVSDASGSIIGNSHQVYLDEHAPENVTYSTCPEFVDFTNPEYTTFVTQMCYADSDKCYTREDIKMTYEDNASKVITYYDTTNSNSTIKIKVLKIPDDNGKEYKIVLNDNKEISHVNEMSKYYDLLKLGTSDTYPGYIYEKNGSYTISEKEPNVYKKENTEGYDKVYMLGLGMLEIQGFGGDKIEATCKSMFDDSFVNLVKRNFFRLIYIGVPILLLVLTTFDFAQVVFVDDKDGIQNAFKKFKKRLVVAVLIYFVPVILNTLIDIVGVDKVGECIKTFTELK